VGGRRTKGSNPRENEHGQMGRRNGLKLNDARETRLRSKGGERWAIKKGGEALAGFCQGQETDSEELPKMGLRKGRWKLGEEVCPRHAGYLAKVEGLGGGKKKKRGKNFEIVTESQGGLHE